MAALRVEKISVFTGVEQDGELKNLRDFGVHDFGGFIKTLPEIERECRRKSLGYKPRPFFTPVSEEKAFVCVSDDVQSPLPNKYPPNAIIHEGKNNFHIYALPQKHSAKYYNFLTEKLCHIYGAIQKHLPLPGFGEADVESFSWASPVEMERYAHKEHAKWKATTGGEKLALTAPVSQIGKKSEWRRRQSANSQASTIRPIEMSDPMHDIDKMSEFAESERAETMPIGRRAQTNNDEKSEFQITQFDSTSKRTPELIKVDNSPLNLEQKVDIIDNSPDEEPNEIQERLMDMPRHRAP